MNRIARIVFTGILAGLTFFIVGNIIELSTSVFIPSPETGIKMGVAVSIFLTFLFDIIAGLLITFAYGIVCTGLGSNRVVKGLSFAAVLFFVSAVPRAAEAYLSVSVPNATIASWFVGWAIEGVFGAFIIALSYPEKKPTVATDATGAKTPGEKPARPPGSTENGPS